MKHSLLNIKQVENAKSREKPYMLSDGGNLYLRVRPGESKSWVFRFTLNGRVNEMGLGDSLVSLKTAREKAAAARQLVALGINPVEEKRLVRAAKPSKKTFGQCATAVVKAKQSEWRSEIHAEQWRMTLEVYAAPLWATPVNEIDTAAILSVLQPLWERVPETASRTRGRIEATLDYAKAHGWRSGENPAAWRGHLALILPKRGKLSRGHHAALPYDSVPAFMQELREQDTMASLALQFLILAAARSGEVLARVGMKSILPRRFGRYRPRA